MRHLTEGLVNEARNSEKKRKEKRQRSPTYLGSPFDEMFDEGEMCGMRVVPHRLRGQ
jgi:hypothetical protein